MANKLVLAIVQDQDAGRVLEALIEKKFGATRINTAGGFLKRGNATILVGVDEAEVDDVILTIDSSCEARQVADKNVTVGGGTVFVLGVDSLWRL